MDNISIKAIRFAIYQYQDGIIEIKDLLTKIEEILNEYNQIYIKTNNEIKQKTLQRISNR